MSVRGRTLVMGAAVGLLLVARRLPWAYLLHPDRRMADATRAYTRRVRAS